MCRYPPLFGLIVGLMFVPAFAQSPSGSAAEFASFLNELWPQAKARGMQRAIAVTILLKVDEQIERDFKAQ